MDRGEKQIQRPRLSEILAPFRRQVRESGISHVALASLFEESREEAWRERRKAEPKP